MAYGLVDGALIVDTGINNAGFFRDARQFKAAMASLKDTVNRVGRDMDKAGSGFGATLGRNLRAARQMDEEIGRLEQQARELRDALDKLASARLATDALAQNRREVAKLSQQWQELKDKRENAMLMDDSKGESRYALRMDDIMRRVRELRTEREKLFASGKGYVSGADTETWRRMSEQLADVNERINALHDQRASVDPIARGFDHISNAAKGAAASMARLVRSGIHSFLNRLASGMKAAAVQAAKLAGGVGKALGSGLRKLGTLAGHAARSMIGLIEKGLRPLAALAGRAARGMAGLFGSSRKSGQGFQTSLRSMLRYGLGIRSLFALFNRLRSAISEGFEALSAYDPRVRASLASLRASLGGARNALASAFAPVVNAVAPALTLFIDLVTRAVNAVGMFFAALTGQSYYTAAQGVASIGSAASGSAGEVKRLQRQLAGFDQLDILKADSESGGGGGGGASGGGGLFETVPIDSGIAQFVDNIKRLFADGKYDEVGRAIAQGINGAIDRAGELISWDNLGPRISQMVDSVAGIFNGLVDGIDWKGLGRTFGIGANTFIRTVNRFFDKTEFEGLGKGLGDALNGLVSTVNWEELGSAFRKRMTATLDVLLGAARAFEWGEAGRAFARTINGLYSAELFTKLSKLLSTGINGAVQAMTEAVGGFEWGQVGRDFAKALNRLMEDTDWASLGNALKKGISAAFDVLYGFVSRFSWGEAGQTFARAVKGLYSAELFTKLSKLLSTGINGAVQAMAEAVGGFEWGQVGEDFAKAVNRLTSQVNWTKLGSTLAKLLGTAVSMMKNFLVHIDWGDAGTKLGEAINGFLGNEKLWEDAGETVSGALKGILNFTRKFTVTLNEKVAAQRIRSALEKIDFKGIAADFWDNVKAIFNKAINFADILLGGEGQQNYDISVADAINEKLAIKNGDIDSKSGIYKLAYDLAKKISEILGSIPWTTILEDVKEAFLEAFSGMLDGLFDSENGDVVIKIAGAVAGIKLAPKLIKTIGESLFGGAGASGAGTAASSGLTAGLGGILGKLGLFTSGALAVGAAGYKAGNVVYDYLREHFGDVMDDLNELTVEAIQDAIEEHDYTGKKYTLTGKPLVDAMLAIFNGKSVLDKIDKANLSDENGSAASDEELIGLAKQLIKMGYSAEDILRELKLSERQSKVVAEAIGANTEAQEGWEVEWTKEGNALEFINGGLGDLSKYKDGIFEGWSWVIPAEVAFIPEDSKAEKYKNKGLLNYLKEIFAPGTDAKTRVELIKKGWKTLASFIGAGKPVSTLVQLVRKGWETLSSWVNGLKGSTTVSQYVALAKLWNTVSAWVNGLRGNTTVNQFVTLAKLWSTVSAWVNGLRGNTTVSQYVALAKLWNTVSAWVNGLRGNTTVSQYVTLAKLWYSVSAWVNGLRGNTAVSQYVTLAKLWYSVSAWVNSMKGNTTVSQYVTLAKLWYSVSAWVNGLRGNTTVSQYVTLAKLWYSVSAWVNSMKGNTTVSQYVGLTKLWSTVSAWVSGLMGNTAVNQYVGLTKLWSTVSAWVSSLMGWTDVTQEVGLAQRSGWGGWSTVSNWVSGLMGGTDITQKVGLTQATGWSTVSGWVDGKKGSTNVLQTVNLTNAGSNWVSGIVSWITGGANAVSLVVNLVAGAVQGFQAIFGGGNASGGIITAAGRSLGFASGGVITGSAVKLLSSVPHYAAGTSRAHGTVFVAGEAGPEVMGHINGRTEILNKSQIAQAIYSAVVAGMGQAVNALGRYVAAHMTACTNAIVGTMGNLSSLSALNALEFRVPAMASGGVMPYEVSAQIARSAAELQSTLDANNEDLIQTIIGVAGQIVAAIQSQPRQSGSQSAGGPSTRQIIEEINRRTQMFSASPLKGV